MQHKVNTRVMHHTQYRRARRSNTYAHMQRCTSQAGRVRVGACITGLGYRPPQAGRVTRNREGAGERGDRALPLSGTRGGHPPSKHRLFAVQCLETFGVVSCYQRRSERGIVPSSIALVGLSHRSPKPPWHTRRSTVRVLTHGPGAPPRPGGWHRGRRSQTGGKLHTWARARFTHRTVHGVRAVTRLVGTAY